MMFLDALGAYIRRADAIQLHGNGEPLLSQSFWRALEHVGKIRPEGECVSINSNGLLLNETAARRLIHGRLHDITISLDAATHETYRKISRRRLGHCLGKHKTAHQDEEPIRMRISEGSGYI